MCTLFVENFDLFNASKHDKTSRTPKSTSLTLENRIATNENAFIRNRNSYIAKEDCSLLQNMASKVTREKVHIQQRSMQEQTLASNPTSMTSFLSETSSKGKQRGRLQAPPRSNASSTSLQKCKEKAQINVKKLREEELKQEEGY